jgi:hypothetical protein
MVTQIDKPDSWTDGNTNRQKYTWMGSHIEGGTNGQTDEQTGRRTDR